MWYDGYSRNKHCKKRGRKEEMVLVGKNKVCKQ